MSLEAIYGPRRCLNTADAGSNWNLDKVYLYLNHRNVYRWLRSRSEMFITLLEQRVSTNSSHCVHFSIVFWHKGEEMKHTVYLKLLLTSISVRWQMLPLARKLQFVGICLSPQRKWALFELKCQIWLRPQPNFNISLSLEDFWECYLIAFLYLRHASTQKWFRLFRLMTLTIKFELCICSTLAHALATHFLNRSKDVCF